MYSRISKLALLGVLGLWAAACASDDTGVIPITGSVEYFPEPGSLSLEAFERVEFRAVDEDGNELSPTWTVDGTVQTSDGNLSYQAAVPGANFEVTGEVEHRGQSYRATWNVEVSLDNSTPTPVVQVIDVVEGAVPGSIYITWETPAQDVAEVPVREYDVYIDGQAIDESRLDEVLNITLPLDEATIQQELLVEDLPEREFFYVRVRVRDELDRLSGLSPEFDDSIPPAPIGSESTGHFDVSGRIRFVQPLLPPLDGEGVLVELGEHKVVTESDGSFELAGLPDLLRERLIVAEESGAQYYELESFEPLPPTDFTQVELVLIPRGSVRIEISVETDPEFLETLEFVELMTGNQHLHLSRPRTNIRWENYPVDVYVHPFALQGIGGETVDYELGFERGVAAWNALAGTELLRIVQSEPAVGVDYVVEELTGSLGETRQLIPSPTDLFDVVPERLRIALEEFSTQVLADRVIAHELGHVLMLERHSPSRLHVMGTGAPSASEGVLKAEEALVALVIASLPSDFDFRWMRHPDEEEEQAATRGRDLRAHTVGESWCGNATGPFDSRW